MNGKSQMRDAIRRLRLGEDYDAALDISVKSCPALPDLTEERLEAPTMNELNAGGSRWEPNDARRNVNERKAN